MRTEKLEYYRKAKIYNTDVEQDLRDLDRLLRTYIGVRLFDIEDMTPAVKKVNALELEESIRETYPERLI